MDHLNQILRRQIVRMRLTCEHQQRGTFWIVQQPTQAAWVGEQEIGALVSGEAARKADGEDIGLRRKQMRGQALDQRLAVSIASMLEHNTLAHLSEHFAL